MQPQGSRPVVISFNPRQLSGWIFTFVACLVPVIAWMTINPISEAFASKADAFRALGQITGLVGMVMYALNLFYATRLRFLENWFGGLNRVYIAHHLLGGLALVMLAFHPFFLALRYAVDSISRAMLLLVPNGLTPISAIFDKSAEMHVDVVQQWAIFLGLIAFLGMVVLLLVTFFVKLPYRIWLVSHKFLGFAFFFAGLHVLFISSDTSTSTFLRFYILGWTMIGLVAFIYRSLIGRILIRRYQHYVDDVNVIGGNVVQLVLRPVKERLAYKPGQFVFIRFLYSGADGVGSEWHPFTISSAPNDDFVRISVKALGDYTSALMRLKQGSIAEIEGAYGKFSYTNFSNPDQIWIAGGIGITPFLSMARSLTEKSNLKVDLYYSVKTASELIDWDDLARIANFHGGNFRVIPFVADQQHGFLGVDFIEYHSKTLLNKEVFLCGPPPMMKSLRKQLRDKGVLNTMIHSEEFAMS